MQLDHAYSTVFQVLCFVFVSKKPKTYEKGQHKIKSEKKNYSFHTGTSIKPNTNV